VIEMSTVIVAVSIAAVVLAGSALVSRRSAARAGRRIDQAREALDEQLQALSADLQRIVERARRAKDTGAGELALILDLDDLLGRLCERTATVTGGRAAAVRVRGPDDSLVTGSFGVDDAGSLLEASVPPPGRRSYRALSVSWAIPTAGEYEREAFGSALVVPIVEDGVESGTLVAFADETSAFRAEATRVLEELAQKAAPAIANARRFAQTARHSFGSPARRPEPDSSTAGVEALDLFRERLAREVARAHGLEESLALLIVAVDDGETSPSARGHRDDRLTELAGQLGEGLRVAGLTTPIGAGEVAVLLPQATAVEAESLYEALGASFEAGSPDDSPRPSLSAGITELVRGDDPESVLERAHHALAQARQLGEGIVVVATAGGQPRR
jgi:GGDEF domain-containing protein